MNSSYENPWIYLELPFESEGILDFHGFVYRITNLTNTKQYIGRKNFWSYRKQKGKTRKVKKESDWKKYYGSSDLLKEDIKILGKNNFKREILSLHKTQGKVNYEETKQLFVHNVLIEAFEDGTSKYYNHNILGRYYKKDYFKKLD